MLIAGLILAGGQGRRLGGADKALLPLAGKPLLDHVLARLRPQLGALALSANGDPARFAAWGLPVLPDAPLPPEAPAAGPLGGLLAGLGWAAGQGAEMLLSVPVDTPFVPDDLVARLWPAPACAASAGRVHHLVGLWPVAPARAALHAMLARPGPRAVAGLGAALGCRAVAFAAPPDPFLNLNTPADLAAAAARGG